MTVVDFRKSGAPKQNHARSVLYIGSAANEFCEYFTRHIGDAEFTYKELVYDAFLAARSHDFDVVVVDQRGEKLATKLVLPVLSSLTRIPAIVVVCEPKNVSQYLRVPGVGRVVASPVNQQQLLQALGLEKSKRKEDPRPTTLQKPSGKPAAELSETPPLLVDAPIVPTAGASVKPKQLKIPPINIGMLISLISAMYKRAAFVLLASLFAAFCFYGLLIVFFLFSSSWAAPVTLTKGHELVLKAEAQLAQLRVDLNSTEQKIAEAQLDSDTAIRDKESAKLMMEYSIDTIAKDLKSLTVEAKTNASELKRLERIVQLFQGQLSQDGMQSDLDRLYKLRLINKKAYNSSALGVLDATQRLQQLESQLSTKRNEMEDNRASIAMLQSLLKRLKGDSSATVTASSPEFLQLAKQAFDARSVYDASSAQFKIAKERLRALDSSRSVIEQHTSELESAPPARAINGRVDVLFVPYGNETSMSEGATLYSCSFTVLWCSKAGTVGARIPGESASVHPFFGKPIRGFFVEVNLTDPHAATREIMHAGRPPFVL
jgi:hypothetical protein